MCSYRKPITAESRKHIFRRRVYGSKKIKLILGEVRPSGAVHIPLKSSSHSDSMAQGSQGEYRFYVAEDYRETRKRKMFSDHGGRDMGRKVGDRS